eukprot:3625691-Amphidinium_carterae.1
MEKDSRNTLGLKVRDGSLSAGLAYYAFCCQKVLEHPGPQQETIRWLLDRDQQTGAKARSLHLEGFPDGEALRASRETHLAVMWTTT